MVGMEWKLFKTVKSKMLDAIEKEVEDSLVDTPPDNCVPNILRHGYYSTADMFEFGNIR
jgi:hypothetical protein